MSSAPSSDPAAFARSFVERRRRRAKLALDADVGRLSDDARAAARFVWTRRLVNETASVVLAERLLANVVGAGLSPATEGAARGAFERLAEDERAHVSIAHEVLAALGGPPIEAPAVEVRPLGSAPIERLLHDVVVGLYLCENVSASRFASVWAATDLPAFRERIGIFLRDEIAHAALGRALVAPTIAAYTVRAGTDAAEGFVVGSLESATTELVAVVARGSEKSDLPPPRPQPTTNPGIVEPAVDARALYRTLDTKIAPLLASLADGALVLRRHAPSAAAIAARAPARSVRSLRDRRCRAEVHHDAPATAVPARIALVFRGPIAP